MYINISTCICWELIIANGLWSIFFYQKCLKSYLLYIIPVIDSALATMRSTNYYHIYFHAVYPLINIFVSYIFDITILLYIYILYLKYTSTSIWKCGWNTVTHVCRIWINWANLIRPLTIPFIVSHRPLMKQSIISYWIPWMRWNGCDRKYTFFFICWNYLI